MEHRPQKVQTGADVSEDENGLTILKAKVERAFKDMKRRKVTDDDIPVDILK